MGGPEGKFELARTQLARIQAAAVEPTDWSDLAIYGFWALENAVVAAADHLGVPWKKNHPSKAAAARTLTTQHGLPDIYDLLAELNSLRKAEAYGEARSSARYQADEIVRAVEEYIQAVAAAIGGV